MNYLTIKLRNQAFYDQLQPRAKGLSYFHPRCAARMKSMLQYMPTPVHRFLYIARDDQPPIMKCKYLYWLLYLCEVQTLRNL